MYDTAREDPMDALSPALNKFQGFENAGMFPFSHAYTHLEVDA